MGQLSAYRYEGREVIEATVHDGVIDWENACIIEEHRSETPQLHETIHYLLRGSTVDYLLLEEVAHERRPARPRRPDLGWSAYIIYDGRVSEVGNVLTCGTLDDLGDGNGEAVTPDLLRETATRRL